MIFVLAKFYVRTSFTRLLPYVAERVHRLCLLLLLPLRAEINKEEGFDLFESSGALADTVHRPSPGTASRISESRILGPVRTSSIPCSGRQRCIAGRV
jgi:hypothetical protein